jgi:20S proteasome alpha/beta subunit
LTLVVGILCGEEGAVIAADKQASLGAFGNITVGQPVTKIKIIGDNAALFASSGSMGLGQQLESIVESKHQAFSRNVFNSMMGQIQPELRKVLGPSYEMAKLAGQVVPGAAMEAVCLTLIAGHFKDGLRVAETDSLGNYTYLTHEMPFVCLGSGKQNADPILRYLWTIYYFDGRSPTLKEGTLLAFWAVDLAIKHLKSGGVGFATDVFVLARDDGTYKASKVDDAQLQLHSEFIEATQEAIRSVQETATGEAPTPPTLD